MSALQSDQIAADDDLSSTALSIAPADAAFFSTSVNLRDAWKDLLEGKFVTRLRAVPYIQELEQEFGEQWENPQGQLAQARGMIENPNIRNLLKLGKNMFSDEVFVYGGDDWCEMIDGLMDFQNEMTSQMSSGPEAIQQFFSSLEKEDIDQIRIPTTVIGFRLDDDGNARMQLDALHGIASLFGSQIEQAKPFLQKLKRSDLRDGQTLALSLDTSLIPLDQLDDEGREIANKAIELLEGRSFSIALGVKSNILLIAFGEGDSVIDSVGESTHKLVENEAFSVLKEAASTDLRSISFVSKRWRESQWNANFGKYFQRLSGQFSGALMNAAEEMADVEQWQHEIETDAKWIDEHLADMTPKFGAMVSWANAIEDGAEGYTYDWNENVAWENAAPLTVTEHAGEMPLILFGFKHQTMPVLAELCEYVLDKAPRHVERFIALAERDEEERERVSSIVQDSWPLVRDAYAILRDKITPSLADNENLIAVAGSWTTAELGPNVPPPSAPLPLPEVAGACKLADRDLFLQGCEELYAVFDRVVDLVRENDPDAVPVGYTVPRPEEETFGDGTRYFYSELSEAVPLYGFQPQLIVGQDVLIYGYSDRQVRDMSKARLLNTSPAWLTDDTPVAAVSYFDCAGIVVAIRPWIEYGLMMTGQGLDEPLAPQPGPIPTGNDILQIWDCFTSAGKSAATVTAGDHGPTVTRWVWIGE